MIPVAIGGAGAAMLALFALLVILGAPAFARLLHSVLDAIPIVGGAIAGAVDGFFNAAAAQAQSWLNWLVDAIALPFAQATYSLGQLGAKLVSTATNAKQWAIDAYRAAGIIGADVLAQAQTYAAQLFNTVDSWMNQITGLLSAEIHQVAANLAAGVGDLNAAIGRAYNTLLTWTNDVWAAAQAGIAGAVTHADQAAGAAVSEAVGYTNQVAGTLAGDIAAVAAQAEQYTAVAVADLGATVAPTAADVFNAGTAAIDRAVHDIVAAPWAELLPVAGAVPAGVVGAIAGTVTAVGALTTGIDDCVTPNCGTLKSLGSLDRGLTDLAAVVLLMGLAADAVADPAQAAATVVSAGGWIPAVGLALAGAVGVTVDA